MYLLTSSSSDGYIQLIAMLIVFVIILYASYAVTKWLAKKGVIGARTHNIKCVEVYRISQNKQIAIVQIGKSYHAVGMSKEHIEYLTKVDADELEFQENDDTMNPPAKMGDNFSQIFKNAMGSIKKDGRKPKE